MKRLSKLLLINLMSTHSAIVWLIVLLALAQVTHQNINMKTRILSSLPWLQLHINPTWGPDPKGQYLSFYYGLPGTIFKGSCRSQPPLCSCNSWCCVQAIEKQFYDAALSDSRIYLLLWLMQSVCVGKHWLLAGIYHNAHSINTDIMYKRKCIYMG